MFYNAIIGMFIGAGFGYFYSVISGRFGTQCPLMCKPWISTVIWGLVGLAIGKNFNHF